MADRSDGSVSISVDLNITEAEKELARLKREILKTEEVLSVGTSKKSNIETSLKNARAELEAIQKRTIVDRTTGSFIIAPDDAARIAELQVKIRELEASLQGVNGEIQEANMKLEAQQYRFAEVQSAADDLRATEADAAEEADNTANALGRSSDKAANAAAETRQLGNELREAGDSGEDAGGRISAAMASAEKRMDAFGKRITGLIKRVFVFTLITKALRGLRDYLWDSVKASDAGSAAIARLKGALLTLAQPLINVIIPAIITLIDLLAKAAATAASIVSGLFGTTVEASAAQAEAANEARAGLGGETKALKATGKAAKDAQKQLAGFDEIQQLTGSHADENASGGGGISAESGTAPDFASVINGQLNAIEELFVGMALLALGAILTFSGANIVLGIGLMALGAMAVYQAVATDWNAIVEALQGPLGAVMAAISGALLVIGLILALSGANIVLGIALIAIGAAGLAATAAANWDAIVEALQGPLGAIVALASGALLAIGLILTLSGVAIPLGIGLIAAGAIGLAATAAANWDAIVEALQGPLGAIIAIASGALLVIGIILLFTGVGIPLGIGLILLGAAGLAAAIIPNWDWIVEKLSEVWDAIYNGIITAWTAIKNFFSDLWEKIKLGVITAWNAIRDFFVNLWESIKNIAISVWTAIRDFLVGLWGAIAKGVSTAWNAIRDFFVNLWGSISAGVTTAWNAIKDFFVGIWKGITDTFTSAWNGLKEGMSALWASITDGVKAAWDGIWGIIKGVINLILSGVEGFINGIIDIINVLLGGISDIASVFSELLGFDKVDLRISHVNIPRLAQGAVIPPNREFLAVLGDQTSGRNIEAPEGLIRQIVMEAMQAAGGQNVTINFTGSLAQLGRVLQPVIETERGRRGGALVT